jgi:hypothetical protein
MVAPLKDIESGKRDPWADDSPWEIPDQHFIIDISRQGRLLLKIMPSEIGGSGFTQKRP